MFVDNRQYFYQRSQTTIVFAIVDEDRLLERNSFSFVDIH